MLHARTVTGFTVVLIAMSTLGTSAVCGQEFDALAEPRPIEGALVAQADQPAPPARPRAASRAQSAPTEASASAEPLLKRYDETLAAAAQIAATFAEARPQAVPETTVLRLVPEELHLGRAYLVGKQVRYLAMRVWLVNTSDEPVTVDRQAFGLRARGVDLPAGEVPKQPGLTRLPMGRGVVELSELEQAGPLTVPAGEAVAVPVGFFELPGTTDVPEMTLRLPVGEATAELDLNDYALGLMRPTVERIGPKGLLGIVTLRGEITPVGAGGLVDLLDRLVHQQTTRVVINWQDGAEPVHAELANWLVQSAMRLGGAPQNDGRFPVLPSDLVALHLASIPDGTGVPNYPGPRRVHQTLEEAATAALAGAFEQIPLDELRREILSGHPLTRPAAIAAGERLPEERLLLDLSADDQPDIARAAVLALRGFGSAAAIDRLVTLAKDGPEPIRSAAVESLAASRYGAAHEALRALLDASADGMPVVPPRALITVLARYPRPAWADPLHRMARQGDPAVRADALEALAKLGHPQLIETFEAALREDDERLRTRAFSLVAQRQETESESLAISYTLEHLKTSPPTREMQQLLLRTKEPRAVPLLLAHLEAEDGRQADLIRLLSKIGGLEVREHFETLYPRLERSVQPAVLTALSQMQSPKFYDYAGAALRSDDRALANAAQQQLQLDAGPEAVQLLAAALFESDKPHVISYAANGLATIGTPDARVALRKAARSSGSRGQLAGQAWWNLQQQSAGWRSFLAGRAASEREEWKQAAERYSETVELDPLFIDAWSGRANAHMQLEEYAQARADYEKTLELDAEDAAAITCLGILRVFEGHVEEGLSFVRDRAGPFGDSELFAYNTACLYAVAAERLDESDPPRAERLRIDAVKELERSIKLGMTHPEHIAWIRKDPDLKSLRGRPDFEKVVQAAEANIEREPRTR